MAAISAAELVFSTPELLETILLYLDQSALLTCAFRVNHTFHAVITSSPSLQEHLFLRPRRPHRWDSLQANPLIFAMLPVRFYYQELVSERRFRRDPDHDPGRAAHTPDDDLDSSSSPPPTRPPTGLDVYRRIGPRPGEPVVDDRRSDWDVDDPFTRPEASWRHMLAVQPVLAASAAGENGWGGVGSNGVSGGTGVGGYCGGRRLSTRKKWSAVEAAYYTSHYDYLQRLYLTRGSPLPPESFLSVHADLRMARVVARARRILTTSGTSSGGGARSGSGSGSDDDSVPLLFGIKFMMKEGDAKAAAGGGWARGGGALQQDGIDFRTRRGGKRIVFLRTDFPPGCCEGESEATT